MENNPTVPRVIHHFSQNAKEKPEAPAIYIPEHGSLTYQELNQLSGTLASYLSGMGIGPADAVATALPEGYETVIILFGIVEVAVAAPLIPSMGETDVRFCLQKVRPRVLIVSENDKNTVIQVARELGIEIIRVAINLTEKLLVARRETPGAEGRIVPGKYTDDEAFLMFTSATTGMPKLVPLTHRRVSAMITGIRRLFPKIENGRALLVLPHFHLQWLASLLLQMESGGAVISTRGFESDKIRMWLETYRPTQFSVNPTILSAILTTFAEDPPGDLFKSLRYMVSAGSMLPEAVSQRTTELTGVPVAETYGLTETGQISIHPPDKNLRREGSVGICCGAEVAIVDEDGTPLPIGSVGEVVVRGETVFTGYIDEPEVNLQIFRNGWFRTGDLGRVDNERFLYLEGRIKEMINRGAEKILPKEVEEVIQMHPSVKDAAVFGYPHPRLGEDVGACLVLKSPVLASDLRKFMKLHLAWFKVPRLLLVVDEIPKGPTGKPQRSQLSSLMLSPVHLERSSKTDDRPLSETEQKVAQVWSELLELSDIGRGDDFFLLGGDSLIASQMVLMVESMWNIKLDIEKLTLDSTLGTLATMVDQQLLEKKNTFQPVNVHPLISLLRKGDQGIPLFLMPLLDGNLLVYRDMLNHLEDTRSVYAFVYGPSLHQGMKKPDVSELCSRFIKALEEVRPTGPYMFAGYSFGGLLALEMAVQLVSAGRKVAGVILFDTYPFYLPPVKPPTYRERLLFHLQMMQPMNFREKGIYLARKIKNNATRQQQKITARFAIHHTERPVADLPWEKKHREVHPVLPFSHLKLVKQAPYIIHRFRKFHRHIPTLLLWCSNDPIQQGRDRMLKKWKKLSPGSMTIANIPGEHGSVMIGKNIKLSITPIIDFLQSGDQR